MPAPGDEIIETVTLDIPFDRMTLSWLVLIARDDVEAAEFIATVMRDLAEYARRMSMH